jgi:hypothetical protein
MSDRKPTKAAADDDRNCLNCGRTVTPAQGGRGTIWVHAGTGYRACSFADRDAFALDQLARLLSSAEWPGASGMEDVEQIVLSTGRDTDQADAPTWGSH